MKKWIWIFCILVSQTVLADAPRPSAYEPRPLAGEQPKTHDNETDVPRAEYQAFISDDGPMSEEKTLAAYVKEQEDNEESLWIFDKISKLGDKNYTYVRCHYRQNPSSSTPQVAYEWAKDDRSKDYKLPGKWVYGKSILPNNSMFFTQTSQREIEAVCQRTLKSKNIHTLVVMVSAANNALSYDNMIWSHDDSGQGNRLNRIVVFGDSLSDSHNMFNNSSWLMPNRQVWSGGRFSNGQIWTERLADDLNLPLYTWAMGGAAATTYKGVVEGIRQQVTSFRRYMRAAENYRPENTLFVFWIGANDLMKPIFTVDELMNNVTIALNDL